MSSTSVFFFFLNISSFIFSFLKKILPVSDKNNRNDLVSVVMCCRIFDQVGDIGGLCKERGEGGEELKEDGLSLFHTQRKVECGITVSWLSIHRPGERKGHIAVSKPTRLGRETKEFVIYFRHFEMSSSFKDRKTQLVPYCPSICSASAEMRLVRAGP